MDSTLDVAPIIPVELVTIGDETNIRAAVEDEPEPEPEPEPAAEEQAPEPEPPAVQQAEATPPPRPEVVPPAPEPAPPPPEPRPEPVVEPEPEPEPTPPPPPRPEPRRENFDLNTIANLVDKAREDDAPRDTRSTAGEAEPERAETARRSAGLGSQLTISEYDALRARMMQCWRMPADAPDPSKLSVSVDVRLNRDGTLDGAPRLRDSARIAMSGDPYLRIAADRAVRAVQQCAPYSFLPSEKYSTWRELTMNFEMTP
jgi:outer membrane biosynthesis protein TonB